MNSHSFRGKSLDEATRAARTALGDDAMILTTRKVRRSGFRGWFGARDIEIAAQPGDGDELPTTGRRPLPGPFAEMAYTLGPKQRGAELTELKHDIARELRSIQATVQRSSAAAPALESELTALREAVERMATQGGLPTGAAGRILAELGLEGRALTAISRALRKFEDPDAEMLRDAFADVVPPAPWPLATAAEDSKVRALIALVGPSGVGKTTTAAKLAARAILDQGRTVTLISSDGYRVGATEQLERFATLLGAEMVNVSTPLELHEAIDRAKTDLVIIDTAGRLPDGDSPLESAISRAGKGKVAGKDRTRSVLLCLPASVRAGDADRFARAFSKAAPTAIAITKLDETRSPAGLVHAPVAAKLPVSVLCFGQRVPEDIAPATSGLILDYLVPMGKKRRSAA